MNGPDPSDFDMLIAQLQQGGASSAFGVSGGLPAVPGNLHGRFLPPEPKLLPIPHTTRGFRLRIDLQHTKPPVWRRIEAPGDLTLPELHDAVQAVMGWADCHLHQFRTGNDRHPPRFLTQFDLAEGDEGMLEDDVRLDQVVGKKGDRLWYDYDFGDGWEHSLRVEEVLETPPDSVICVAGKLACPPEDCGGVWGHHEISNWVRGNYADALRPPVFESTAEGRDWLPEGWHPDVFDLAEANELLAAASAVPPEVTEELALLLTRSFDRGPNSLHSILSLPASHGTIEIDAEDAARALEPFLVLLEVIGAGSELTGAGYLKPALVEQISQRTGLTDWWVGKANREDITRPIASLRNTARVLGLVAVRKGRITPTLAAKRCAGDPRALLTHVMNRLPLGKSASEREAGWAALAVAGSEMPPTQWDQAISAILFDLGWRSGNEHYSSPPAESDTLRALRLLAGELRIGWRMQSANEVISAIARAVVRA